jgi:hypothetical protein
MNRTVLAIGIIFLLAGISINSTVAVINRDDDTIPPVSTHSLNPPEPDGNNGWYTSDVNVTLSATDDMSGVKEIKYRVWGGATQTIIGDTGTFLITQADDMDDVPVEYWAIDNAGNEETPHNEFTIDMDQTKPNIDATTVCEEGNPIQGWLMHFTATCDDDTSGMERIEFYINDELQDTVYGSGPEYQWDYRYYGDVNIDVIGYAYDNAGNMESDIFPDPWNFNNQNTQLSKSTDDTNESEPDKHNVDYDYAKIGGYCQYISGKGIFLVRDVWFNSGGQHSLYLDIEFYRFPDILVYRAGGLTDIKADYFIFLLSWWFNPSGEIKGIAFGNIEWWG